MGNNKAKGRMSARRAAAFLGVLGALVMSSGIALMVAVTPANAADCVPAAAYTETTDWVTTSPGAAWTQIDSRIKTPATDAHWTDLVWHNYTGQQPDSAPALDDPNWHALPAQPAADGHSLPTRVPGVPYNISHNDEGNGSWFLITGTLVPATDAVYEYRYSLNHAAVTCPSVSTPQVEGTTVVSPPKAHVKAKAKVHAAAVTPTVVHAGLGSLSAQDMRGEQGLALMVAGMVMLVGAGGLGLRIRGAASRI